MLVSQALMSAPEISLILATGGPQMVSAGRRMAAAGGGGYLPLTRSQATHPFGMNAHCCHCCIASSNPLKFAGARRLLLGQPRSGCGRRQHAGSD